MDAQQADEALMLLYSTGDNGAFEMLYHRHKGSLYRYMQRHMGTVADVDELFQEVWAKVINAASRYQPTAKFTTWLYTIAHHCIVDHVRKRQHAPTALAVNSTTDEARPEETIASLTLADNPFSQVNIDQQIDLLLHALRALPMDQREVFLLKHEAGFSVAEIANIVGVGEETAKTRLRYGMKKIRETMKGNLAEGVS